MQSIHRSQHRSVDSVPRTPSLSRVSGKSSRQRDSGVSQNELANGMPASFDFTIVPVFPPGQASTDQPFVSLIGGSMPGAPIVWPKLAAGTADDPLELEADDAASQIMRIPDRDLPEVPTSVQVSNGNVKSDMTDRPMLRTASPQSPVSPEITAGPVDKALRSPGQPLDAATRAFMETRFGCDFSGVSLHTDSAAAESARAVNAQAYTVGSHVIFGPQMYAPHSREGRQLLAHELTHVVQQSSAGRSVSAPVSVTQARPARLARQEANTPEPGKAPLSPAIAHLPFSLYVDQFIECYYDVNYKVTEYFSNILHLTYRDGALLELDMQEIVPVSMTSEAGRDAMATGKVGRAGRIFPSVMAPRTLPRLWAAREEAERVKNQEVRNFEELVLIEVPFAVFGPGMPAGEDEASLGSLKATSRRVSPGSRPPTSAPPGTPGGGGPEPSPVEPGPAREQSPAEPRAAAPATNAVVTNEQGVRARSDLRYAELAVKDPGTVYHRELLGGGVREIASTGTLRAGPGTSSFGGGDAVRAYFGPADAQPRSAQVEFTTNVRGNVRVSMGGNHPDWHAEGMDPPIPSGSLPIQIRRFVYPDGSVATPAGGGRWTLAHPGGAAETVSAAELPER